MSLTKGNAAAGDRGVSEVIPVRQLKTSGNSLTRFQVQEPHRLPDLWTYQGTQEIGRYYQGPDGFGTFTAGGDYLGVFATIAVARAVIWAHHLEEQSGLGRLAA